MNNEKYKNQVAISYARASAGKGKGQEHSTDRQSNITLEYCEKLGLKLDLNFRIIDEGVSAYKEVIQKDEYGREKKIAKNLSESALADFVEIVKQGKFPKGVNLIVEKLDRMYRDVPRRALEHFTSLLNNGVTIHTPMDGKIYDPDNDDGMDLMVAIMNLVASHQYSKLLSARIKESVDQRIEIMSDGGRLYRVTKLSDWFEIEYDTNASFKRNRVVKSFYISDFNRNLIQEIFQMYIANLSTKDIAVTLNERNTRNFQKELWSSDAIGNILNNRSVMGFITPKKGIEIFNEEWKIISKADFYLVREIMEAKTAKGKSSPDGNLFSGLLSCGYCLHREKNKKGRPYKNSNLVYGAINDSNRDHTPMKTPERRTRRYFCKSGQVSYKNCNDLGIDYYRLFDSFFAFVKDLDFSSLVDSKSKLQDSELKTKILEIKADIKELDKKIENQKLIQDHLENPRAIIDIAKEIDSLSFEKDDKLSILENKASVLEDFQKSKNNFVENQEAVKDLIKNTYNDSYYTALAKMVLYWNPVTANGRKLKLTFVPTKEQEVERNDINRLWILPRKILDAVKAKDAVLAQQLIEEENSLKNHYFKNEVKSDEEAVQIKKRLNGELRKFIKEIKVYCYGFTPEEASKPFDDRVGLSSFDNHTNHLKGFFGELEAEDNEPKPKYERGWSIVEICEYLKLERRTYKRYLKSKVLPDYKGTNKSLSPLKKILINNGNRGVRKELDLKYSQFFAYSIEFTDICKPNEIRFILPFYKDYSKGVSFNLNTKSGRWKFMESFGDEEIKLRKPKSKPKHNKEIIYIQDDPILRKGFDLLVGYFQKHETNLDAIDSIDVSIEKLKNLKTKEEKQEYIMKIVKDIQAYQHNTIQLNRIIETIPNIEIEKTKELFDHVSEIIENQLKDSC